MGRTPPLRGERSDQSAFLFHSPQTSNIVISTEGTDSLIVCCAVERPRISPLPLLVLAVVFVSGYPKASADAGNVESCLRTRLQPLRYVFFCYAHFFNTLFSLGSLSRSTAQRPPLCRRRGSPTSGSLLVGVNAGVQPEGRNNPSITLVLALAVACSRCKLQKPQQKACQAPKPSNFMKTNQI